MPLLRLDKNGNIVQSDSRFNGVQGIGSEPEMVDSDDVTALSLIEDDKVLKDRAALRRLQHLSNVNKVKKYAQNKVAEEKAKMQAKINAEKKFNKLKAEHYAAQLKKNNSFLKARHTPGSELLSGVSGFGFSADGRQPLLDAPAVDWQPILEANTAFGGNVEDWGHSTGLGYHSNQSVDQLGELSYNPNDVVGDTGLRKTRMPIGEANQAEIINEPMTTDDEYDLRQFIDGAYVIRHYMKNDPRSYSNWITDDAFKTHMSQINNSWNHSSEMAKVIQQGWGYSILDNGKSIRLVKVPYYWGLPMYVPDNDRNLYTAKYFSKTAMYSRAGINNEFRFRTGTITPREGERLNNFQALYPVILAAAKEYALHSDEFGNWQGRDHVRSFENKVIASPEAKNLQSTQTAQVNVSYAHPMLKHGLIK